jgi:hypothetical protein
VKTVEYRINKLTAKVYQVEVVWGLLDVMKLYAGKTWQTYGDAYKAAKKHAEEVCVSPMIVRGH